MYKRGVPVQEGGYLYKRGGGTCTRGGGTCTRGGVPVQEGGYLYKLPEVVLNVNQQVDYHTAYCNGEGCDGHHSGKHLQAV